MDYGFVETVVHNNGFAKLKTTIYDGGFRPDTNKFTLPSKLRLAGTENPV